MEIYGHLRWWSFRPAPEWPLLVDSFSSRVNSRGWRQFLLSYRLPVNRTEELWQKVIAFDPNAERHSQSVVQLKRVVIESPYAGEIERNQRYLVRAMRDSINRGEAPFASHRLYPGILHDTVPAERELGMRLGFAWRTEALLTVVYRDHGISGGMQEGIEDAQAIMQPVEFREIGAEP